MKKPLTTDAAFDLILSDTPAGDYLWAKTGEPMPKRRQYRLQLKKGTGLTLDQKLKILAKAGFTVHQPLLWDVPPG